MHLVCECTALQDLRVSFAPLFQRAAIMQQFMWQADRMRVAHFLEAGGRMMQEIDLAAMGHTFNQPGWLEQMHSLALPWDRGLPTALGPPVCSMLCTRVPGRDRGTASPGRMQLTWGTRRIDGRACMPAR